MVTSLKLLLSKGARIAQVVTDAHAGVTVRMSKKVRKVKMQARPCATEIRLLE